MWSSTCLYAGHPGHSSACSSSCRWPRRLRHREREEVGLRARGVRSRPSRSCCSSCSARSRSPTSRPAPRPHLLRSARRSAPAPDEPRLPTHLVQVTAAELVARCAATLQPLEAAANGARWGANVDAGPETQKRRGRGRHRVPTRWPTRPPSAGARAARTPTPILWSPVSSTCWCSCTLPNQVDADLRRQIVELTSDIESRFARHRGTIDGEQVDDNQILDVLRTSDDSAHRQAAWEACEERRRRGCD